MTEPLFIDNDCLSAFLWVDEEAILPELFPGRIILPEPVYNELGHPRVRHLKAKVDRLIDNGDLVVRSVNTNPQSTENILYYALISGVTPVHKAIGQGEAAAIAMAKEQNGILASNNLRDVGDYVRVMNLKHVTTGDILVTALEQGLISEEQGNEIWAEMIARRRRLGASTFSEYLEQTRSR